MKRIIVAVFIAAVASAHAGLVASLDDIELWAGDGKIATNRAALVIQWNINATSYSFAWGYGWNAGTPTGRDMLLAVDAAETRLSIDFHAGQNTIFGAFLDMNGNASSYTPGTPGVVDYGNAANTIHDVAGSVSDPADLYVAGWADGFWSYEISGGTFEYFDYYSSMNVTFNAPSSQTYAGANWQTSPVGDLGRELSNGSWDRFNYSTDLVDYTSPAAIQPLASVPEPSTAALLILWAIAVTFYAQKRLHSC